MSVGVCAWNADLETGRLGTRGRRRNEANRSGTMLQTPGHGHGSPKVLDEALVRVDRGRDNGHDIGQSVNETREEVSAEIGEMLDVRVGRVGIGCLAIEEVLGRLQVDDGDVHVAAVPRKSFSRLGHETRRNSILAAKRLDGVLEECGFVRHLPDLIEFKSLHEER